MIDKEDIKKLKDKGEIIVSIQTFKKSVKIINDGYEYKNKIYHNATWLLTYGHDQYYHLHDDNKNIGVTHQSNIGD